MYKELTYERLHQLLIIEERSYAQIGKEEGCSGANIKKIARKLGITLSKRRKINPSETFNAKHKKCKHCDKEIKYWQKFCSRKCNKEYVYLKWIERWKDGLESGIKGEFGISNYLREYLFRKYNSKCARCGWSKINPYSGKIPLDVEHIDGDYTNNNEDNLILLCPNCHSLTKTYKGANKGNGRKARRKKPN